MLAVEASARLATRMSRLANTGGAWWPISVECPNDMPGLRLAGGMGRIASGPIGTSRTSRVSSGCTLLLLVVLEVAFWVVQRWKVSSRSFSQRAEWRDGGGPVSGEAEGERPWRVSTREVSLRDTGP
jgi:hypothetical protein